MTAVGLFVLTCPLCSLHGPGRPSKSYQAADIFDVRDEKLSSAMCNWSFGLTIACMMPSERDTGHDLRRRGHSYQLVCYNFSSTRRCLPSL